MIQQLCAICEKNNFEVIYKENFDLKKIDERTFSARRLPDRVHYRIVKCKNCGLVYSNPILKYNKIEKLYKKSFTSYDEHLENLRETYGFYLKRLNTYRKNATGVEVEGLPTARSGALERALAGGKSRQAPSRFLHGQNSVLSLLEIGCGNGFFLEEALGQGYKNVWGVEPGKKSANKAKPYIRKHIIIDIFKPRLFRKNFFDIICCFQTFDHIPNPNELLKECYKVLKKGGYMLFLNHDSSSLSAKILGGKSPIIDIEHTYLYDKNTMRQIFEKHKFKVLAIKSATNIHTLSYWTHLFPLPNSIKLPLIRFLTFIKLADIKIKINPGNIVLIGQK